MGNIIVVVTRIKKNMFLLVEGRQEGSNERRRKSHINMRKEENDRLRKKSNEENIFME